jgi:4-hydroxy-tetrahydrodipicolinate synthase
MVQTITAPNFSGTFTALITPFRHDEIDEPALRSLVDMQIANGISGLVPCGTTGEAATMTDSERDRVISIVIDQANGRVPVIAGTGGNDTRRTVEATQRANELGADAALVVVPYYNKPTAAGLIAHYTAVAEATDLPIILYNVPGRTGINMSAETTLRLAEIPTVAGIKEASGSLDQVSEILGNAPDGFALLSGDDSLTVPMMSLGATGVISVASNIVPAEISRLTNACRLGDFGTAAALHHELFQLMNAMFIENNPTAVKTAAAIMGLCTEELRLPLTAMSATNRERVANAIAAFIPVTA